MNGDAGKWWSVNLDKGELRILDSGRGEYMVPIPRNRSNPDWFILLLTSVICSTVLGIVWLVAR